MAENTLVENSTQYDYYDYYSLFDHPDLEDCRNITLLMNCSTKFVEEYGYDTFNLCLEYVTELGQNDYANFKRIRMASFIIYGCLVTTVCLLGIIGNILSYIIMRSRDFRGSTTSTYMQALMIVDSLYLTANFLYYGLVLGLGMGEWVVSSFPAYARTYLSFNIIDIFRTCSVLLTVAVTAERYIYVCHTFIAAKLCTQTTSKLLIAAMILIAVVFQIPRFFILKVQPIEGNEGCGIMYHILPAKRIPLKAEDAIGYTGFTLFIALPLIVLAVLTTLLIREIKKSKDFRESMRVKSTTSRHSISETKGRKNDNTTIILLSVVITYLICNLPNTIAVLLRYTKSGENWLISPGGKVFYYIGILFMNINSAANVLLFCFFGTKFRRVFARVFFRRQWRKKKATYHSVSQTMYTHIYSRNSLHKIDTNSPNCEEEDIKL